MTKAQASSSSSSSTKSSFQQVHKSLLSVGSVKSTLDQTITKKNPNPILQAAQSSSLYSSSKLAVDPQKAAKMEKSNNLGKGWFNLEPLPMDEKLKKDIQVIQMRNYMDPKKFYKNPDKPGTVVHVGTVIEGPSEYKSSRLTKRERKQTILEEIMGDDSIKQYSKRVFNTIQQQKSQKKRMYKTYKRDKKPANKKVRALF